MRRNPACSCSFFLFTLPHSSSDLFSHARFLFGRSFRVAHRAYLRTGLQRVPVPEQRSTWTTSLLRRWLSRSQWYAIFPACSQLPFYKSLLIQWFDQSYEALAADQKAVDVDSKQAQACFILGGRPGVWINMFSRSLPALVVIGTCCRSEKMMWTARWRRLASGATLFRTATLFA